MSLPRQQLKPQAKNIYRTDLLNDIPVLKEEIRYRDIDKDDVKDSLVRYLVNDEMWEYQKSVNFSNLMDTMFSATPSRPQVHEKVLKFPSKESEQLLSTYLGMAQEAIRVGMYTFTNRNLMKALVDARSRGVTVQLITDKESLSTIYIHEMAAAGIKCTHHNLTNTAKMHHKFAIVDQFLLINGSLNWTAKGVKQNHENVIVSGSPVFIGEFTQEFEQLWK